MPKYPLADPAITPLPGSVYSGTRATSKTLYPLHIGDTWMEPPPGARLEDQLVADNPGMHRYAPPGGLPQLRHALAEHFGRRTGLEVGPEEIIIGAGATGALAAAVLALVAPGEEVLILAPHWPLIAGMVRVAGGRPVQVPILARGEGQSEEDLPTTADAVVAALEAHRGDSTVAVYLSTPNNPTGRLLPKEWLEGIAAWAREQDLWVLADEVYEDYVFSTPEVPAEHVYTRPFAPERTVSIHSFSKAYGMAGNRVGWLCAPAQVLDPIIKVATHTYYCAPRGNQFAALHALGPDGEAWIAHARQAYTELGYHAAQRLGVTVPQGSTFLFPDVGAALDSRGLPGFLQDLGEQGLKVAPGPAFGPYPTHVRICFTCAEPETVRAGVEVLAGALGR
ncbi:MAG: pyridoxal phosphate-dependent aminotransferase [Acidobacteriota bacterium]